MKNWEKELADLCKFTKEEGFDPDRFYSLTQNLLDKQREEIIKLMANTPYMSPRALETLIIKIKTLNK